MINELSKTLSIVFTIVLLSSCSMEPQSFIRNNSIPVSSLNDPQINIIISPLTKWNSQQAKVMVAQVRIDLSNKRLQEGITSILQDIFLQNRTFAVVANHEDSKLQGDDFVKMAQEKGFDHIIYTEILQFTASSGVSPGIVSVSLKLLNIPQDTTLWKFNSKIELIPRPSQDTVFLKIPYSPAPSTAAGFSAIINKISRIVSDH